MFKKVIAAMLCSTMVISSAFAASEYDIMPISLEEEIMPISVDGDVIEEKKESVPDMKAALTAVKSRIDIPDDAEFNYYTYTNELGTVFSFDWSYEVDGDSRYVYVECDENGFIYSYYPSSSSVTIDYKRLPTIDYAKAKSIAVSQLKKLMPKGYSAYKLEEDLTVDYAEFYGFRFQGYKNDIPVNNTYVSVEINGVTGEVNGYHAVPIREDIEYADPSTVIGAAKAGEAFAKLSEAKLVYSNFYDENNEMFVRPVYNVSKVTIDALTGEEADLYQYVGTTNDSAAEEDLKAEAGSSSSAAMDKVQFSEAELNAIEGLAGYLTVEQAEKAVRGYDYFDLSEYKLVNSSMRKYNDDYRWTLEFVKAFDRENEEYAKMEDLHADFTIDAKDGKLYSYSSYDYNAEEPKNPEYYEKKASAEVDKFMDEFVNESIRSKIKLNESEGDVIYTRKIGDRYMYFDYQRVNEGVPYSANSVTLRFDCYTGKISYFRINWDDSIQFPSVRNAISADMAKNSVISLYGFELKYMPVTDEHGKALNYVLVYNLDGNNTTVDALNSGVIEHYAYASSDNDTSKLDGHWAEEYMKKLYSVNTVFNDNGIGAVDPDAEVTDAELIYMLATSRRRFYEPYPIAENYASFASMLVKHGVTDEKITLEGKKISALDAAVYALDAFKYGDVAKLGDIFKTDGLEGIDSDKIGYAAIANAMEILHGEISAESMTYGEAAFMVYKLLSRMQ